MSSPETSISLLQDASRLARAGRLPEAIDAYRRALKLTPALPDAWYNLAHLEQRAGQHTASLASYQQALDHAVTRPEEVHLNRAVIFATQLAQPDAAEMALRSALRSNPGYVPAWLNLGNIQEQRGDLQAAMHAYEHLLLIEPGHALALSRLASLKHCSGPDDPLLERVRQAMADPRTTPEERADLGFGLGKALDDVAAYDQAFAAYQAANQASRMSAGPGGLVYDRAGHERWIDHIIRSFPKPAQDLGGGPCEAQPPLFVCGMFRSGTTLVEQILSGHPQVTAGGEIDLLPRMVRERLGRFADPSLVMNPAMLAGLRDDYLAGIAQRHPGARLVTDKRPDNFLYIGLIKALFPRARIVHTRRDPIDNCLSVYFLHLTRSMPYALDLLDIAHWYGQYRRLMRHWASLYPGEIHEVVYDELVAAPHATIAPLLQYCDLPWDDACVAFHRSKAVVSTASMWQVRQPLYTRSSGRWRHYERHLEALRATLSTLPP